MADFCAQCSVDIWGKDYGDMKGITTERQTKDNLFAVVLCEDCGPCQVDHLGNCVSFDCVKKHGAKFDA